MKKATITSILICGLWGTIFSALLPAVAQNIPRVQLSAATVNSVKTELLEAGAEPKYELKFRPTANTKKTTKMGMDISFEMGTSESQLSKMPFPKIVVDVDEIVNQVDSSGDIHCRFQYSNVQISEGNDIFPDGFELIKTSLESMMQGTTIDIVSDRNGKIKSKNLILPKTVAPKSGSPPPKPSPSLMA